MAGRSLHPDATSGSSFIGEVEWAARNHHKPLAPTAESHLQRNLETVAACAAGICMGCVGGFSAVQKRLPVSAFPPVIRRTRAIPQYIA